MKRDSSPGSGQRLAAARFATTHWTMVLSAGRRPSPQSQAALSNLCQTYWYPLFAYARRRGHDADAAADAIQAFFANLLEKQGLAVADPARGRFRTFLLTSLQNFLANQRRRQRAQKRGGAAVTLSIDRDDAESRYRLEPADRDTPERLFERRWALTVLDRAMGRLRAEYARAGKAELFERLAACVGASSDDISYRDVATSLGLTEGAVKTAVHRLRRRLRERLRDEIAQTVASPQEIDEELRELIAALGPS
jgi:RNA polymerase sigma-70 factor (ECF subfamily)